MPRPANLTALRERIRQIERPAHHGVLSFDVAAIDRALPGGGLALGAVHEILGQGGDEEDGAAAAGFAAGILARLGPDPILWCLKRPDLYGPGLAAHGLDPARLVIVAAPRDEEILWAIEEGLRLPGLAAVVGEVGRLPMVAGRRLQLAAERSGVTALVLRRWRNGEEAAAERERPTAALTRWRVMALPARDIPLQRNPLPPLGGEGRVRGTGEAHPFLSSSPPETGGRGGNNWIGNPRWRVELLRCRGGVPALWDVEVADATGHVSVSAGLADRPAAPLQRSSEPRVRRFS
jgi:protein ImuA